MRSNDEFNLKAIIKQALFEDSITHDITTKALSLGNMRSQAQIITKQRGVCAGINIAGEVFKAVDSQIRFKPKFDDGKSFKAGEVLATVDGRTSSILKAERIALNFLAKLSGIATLTRTFVEKTKPAKTKIFDTRKTTPGLRLIEKYAVRMGGGYNHRQDLTDAVLIKDNHIAAIRKIDKDISLSAIVERFQKKTKSKLIEIEVDTIKDFKEVLAVKPDIIMLDNMSFFEMRECVRIRNRADTKVKLEVSGNVTLDNIEELAKLGVERISIGALTHSPRAVDVSLQLV